MPGPASWLDDSAGKWPKKEAVFDEEISLSFGQLDHAARRAAAWLAPKGKPGDRVVIALPFSVSSTVLYFGALFAGRIAVPVDPRLGETHLQFMLKDADPFLAIGPSELNRASEFCEFYPIDHYRNLRDLISVRTGNKVLPALPDDPSRIVNIVYTSGSTGLPKGVMLTEGNLEAVTRGIEGALTIHAKHRMFTPLSFAHTYGLSQLWLMARTGASLGVVPDITHMAGIRKMIDHKEIDLIAGVPYHFAVFTRRGGREPFHRIEKVTVAGDSPSKRLIDQMRMSFPSARIYLMYGLTEAGTRLTVLPPEDLEKKEGSIGLPIAEVALKVVNEKGRELGAHQSGELIARGKNVTPGYWKDEELTQKTIVDGWLHTGDIVEKDEDGYFYHLGRKDFVFKSGGEKIVPAAIEKVLREIEGVRDAAVLGKEDLHRGNTVCAVIVKEEGSDLTSGEIIAACRAVLERFWVPEEVFFATEIPRTPQGKIRYDVLKEQVVQPKSTQPWKRESEN